jgi:hypothetical protein
MIIANAFPKTGTNLLKKALTGFGLRQGDGQLTRMNPYVAIELAKAQKQEILGDDDVYYHGHVSPLVRLEGGTKMVYIVRNPRNATISFLRWAEKRGQPKFKTNEESLIELIERGAYKYGPWPLAMLTWSAWSTIPSVLTVRFEDICTDGGKSVAAINDRFFNGDFSRSEVETIYENLYGSGGAMPEDKSTYSGEWSNWRECGYWSPYVEERWIESGGESAEKALGYEI